MSVEWARREVELLMQKHESDQEKDSEYAKYCYESALKAYEVLANDEHTGASIALTADILKRLLDGYPLTPIEDVPESWGLVREDEDEEVYQCIRCSSLFKTVQKATGDVSYSDNNRVICVSDGGGTYTMGFIRMKIDEMYPITMPYMPSSCYRVYTTDFALNGDIGSFDTIALNKLKHPDGTVEELNWYYEETEDGLVPITKARFNERYRISQTARAIAKAAVKATITEDGTVQVVKPAIETPIVPDTESEG